MGILTSALDQIVGGMVGVGVNQLNSYITRKIQEGRLYEAAQAGNLAEADLVNLQNYQQNVAAPLMQGRGILPGVNSLTAGARTPYLPVNPSSSGAIDAINYGRQLPQVNPKVFENPYIAQRYLARANQFIENDPMTLRQKAQEDFEKERMGLVKSIIGDYSKQNQVGFQEGLGAFDNPAGFNLTREDRNLRSQERQFGQTTAQYQAAEPFKEKSMQRSMQLKQTPGARAGGAGAGSGSPDGEILSSVTNEDLSRMEKMLMRSSEFYAEEANSSGKMAKVLNNGGAQVLNIAADKLARMKKKNPMLALRQATQEYKKQRGKPEDIIQGADRAANQVLSTPTPAPSSAPQQQGNTVQGQKDPSIEQKISKALQMGRTPEQIKKALETDGLNPAIYGY